MQIDIEERYGRLKRDREYEQFAREDAAFAAAARSLPRSPQ